MENAAAHRIEKRLGKLRLLVFGKQADVVQFHLLPDGIVLRIHVKSTAQVLFAFGDAFIVVRDPLARDSLKFLPVAGFEQRLGVTAGLAKQPVMTVKAVEHSLRNQIGEFGLGLSSSGSHFRLRSGRTNFDQDTLRLAVGQSTANVSLH